MLTHVRPGVCLCYASAPGHSFIRVAARTQLQAGPPAPPPHPVKV